MLKGYINVCRCIFMSVYVNVLAWWCLVQYVQSLTVFRDRQIGFPGVKTASLHLLSTLQARGMAAWLWAGKHDFKCGMSVGHLPAESLGKSRIGKDTGCPHAEICAGYVFRADSLSTLGFSFRTVQSTFLRWPLFDSMGNFLTSMADLLVREGLTFSLCPLVYMSTHSFPSSTASSTVTTM